MPTTIADDRKALDLLSSGRVPNEMRPKVLEKLGVDETDVKAWGYVSSRNDDTSKQVRNKIFEKIADQRPVENPDVISGISAVRFLAKNFIDQDIETQKKFFSKFGYNAKADQTGNLVIYDPKKSRRVVVDPKGLDMWDASDIMTDLLEGIGVGAATIAGAKLGGSAGAAAGAPLGPLGALGAGIFGAGAGGLLGAATAGFAGETIRQGVSLLSDSRDDYDPGRAIDAGKYAALFAPLDLLGFGVTKGGQWLSRDAGTGAIEKETAAKLREAAKVLNVELTPGMIKKSDEVQALEASLRKGVGKIGGQKLRDQIASNKKAVEDVVSSLISPGKDISLVQAGDEFGTLFKESVSNKLSQAIAVYEKYDDIFKNVKLNDALPPAKKGLNTLAEKRGETKYNWLTEEMNNAMAKVYDRVQEDPVGIAIADRIAERIDKIETINGIKVLRQNIRDNARRYRDEPIWQFINTEINPVLKEKRDQAIRKLATVDPNLGETAVNELKLADQIYAKTAREIENVIGKKKLKPGLRSAVNDWLEVTNDIKRVRKVLDTKDPKKIEKLAADFPEAFEVLREGYKTEFFNKMNRYVTRENINVTRVAQELDKLPPETLQVLYGYDGKEVKDSLMLYLKNLPPDINPSDTTKFREFLNLFVPWQAPIEHIGSVLQERKLNRLISEPDKKNLIEYLGKALTVGAKIARPALYPRVQAIREESNAGILPRQSSTTGLLPNQ